MGVCLFEGIPFRGDLKGNQQQQRLTSCVPELSPFRHDRIFQWRKIAVRTIFLFPTPRKKSETYPFQGLLFFSHISPFGSGEFKKPAIPKWVDSPIGEWTHGPKKPAAPARPDGFISMATEPRPSASGG